jgi:hypothetical protein
MSSESEDEDFAEYGTALDPFNEGSINKVLKMRKPDRIDNRAIG